MALACNGVNVGIGGRLSSAGGGCNGKRRGVAGASMAGVAAQPLQAAGGETHLNTNIIIQPLC